MSKVTFAIKLNEEILNNLKAFCLAHGTKFSFFVEKAIEEKLAEEELKEDLLDFKILRKDENNAMSFEKYLRLRDA
ncbi:MAG: hypothetical protein Q8Q10_01135 [bacterium]|nr:hypothetical protein [bacterium]